MKKVDIQTIRLKLRYLELSDLRDFYIYRSDLEVTKYQGFDVMTMKQAENFIKENSIQYFGNGREWLQYGIEVKKTRQLIGDFAIKLDHFDKRIAEVGITISRLEQKKGYGKEALSGILTFLFETKEIQRVVANVDAKNIASINLLTSVGFNQEEHFIENIYFKGKWVSDFKYVMLKSDWDDRKL